MRHLPISRSAGKLLPGWARGLGFIVLLSLLLMEAAMAQAAPAGRGREGNSAPRPQTGGADMNRNGMAAGLGHRSRKGRSIGPRCQCRH